MKKYRVRLVIDDVLEALTPGQAKEDLVGFFRDGYYGSRDQVVHNNVTARRRRDLEGKGQRE